MANTIRIGLGTTVDLEYQALLDAGYEGALNDMMFQWLGDNGHAGGTLTDRLLAHQAASGGITALSQLWDSGEEGAWYDLQDTSTLWQDTSATTAVSVADDPIGRIDDKSGNNNHALQATATLRPLFKTSGGKNWFASDNVDDNMLVGPAGTVEDVHVFIASKKGIMHGKADFSGSQKDLYGAYVKSRGFIDEVYQIVMTTKALTDGEVAQVKGLLADLAVHDALDFSGFTSNFGNLLRGWNLWSHLYAGDWVTTGIPSTAMNSLTRQNGTIEYIDMSSWDFSGISESSRYLSMCALDAANLRTVVLGENGEPFNQLGNVQKTLAFEDTSLSSESIDNILKGVVNSGITGGTISFTNPSAGVGNPPSSTGEGYIDTLRARTWTVTVPGGY